MDQRAVVKIAPVSLFSLEEDVREHVKGMAILSEPIRFRPKNSLNCYRWKVQNSYDYSISYQTVNLGQVLTDQSQKAAGEEFQRRGWALEYTQRYQPFLRLSHSLDSLSNGRVGEELQS